MASGGAEPGPAGPEDNNDQLKQLLYQLAADKETAKLKIADPDFFHGDAKTLRTWILQCNNKFSESTKITDKQKIVYYSATTNFRKARRSQTSKKLYKRQTNYEETRLNGSSPS